MKLFTGKDFLEFNRRVVPGTRDSLDCIAEIANRKLEEWLSQQPEMGHRCRTGYGCSHHDWGKLTRHSQYRCRAVGIEKVEQVGIEKVEQVRMRTGESLN